MIVWHYWEAAETRRWGQVGGSSSLWAWPGRVCLVRDHSSLFPFASREFWSTTSPCCDVCLTRDPQTVEPTDWDLKSGSSEDSDRDLGFLSVCFLLKQCLRSWSSDEQEPQSFRKVAVTAALDTHTVRAIPTIKNRDRPGKDQCPTD